MTSTRAQREFVEVERSADVLHVRLARPERRNAVSEELYADLDDALDEVDDDTGALLLSGAGPSFCAGADLKAHAERDRDDAAKRAYVWAGQRVCRRLQRMPVPVVAAVHGHAIGAGAELALSADVVVCGDDARIRLPEVALGTFVGGGVSHRLPLLVGAARARTMMLLGREISGEVAASWGLVTESVAAADVLDRATELATELATLPPLSVRLAKQALLRAGTTTLDEALVFEAEALLSCMESQAWDAEVKRFARADGARV